MIKLLLLRKFACNTYACCAYTLHNVTYILNNITFYISVEYLNTVLAA